MDDQQAPVAETAPEEPQLRPNRKARRRITAIERRKLCLGRQFPSGYWMPRERAPRVVAKRKAARAETIRRLKVKMGLPMGDTSLNERHDDARQEADETGRTVPEGQLAP